MEQGQERSQDPEGWVSVISRIEVFDGWTVVLKSSPGIAFPTSISVNNVVSHVSPLPSDPEIVLKDGDVVKVMLGVQLDGYAVTHAETVVLSSKVDGVAADVVQAAYDAAQIAMRTVKAGAKNWDVTEVVDKVVKDYECSAVEGMLSCQHEKNITDGKKRIILNPAADQRREHETATFEEGEVYGVDVLVVTGTDGKVCTSLSRTISIDDADLDFRLSRTNLEHPSTRRPTSTISSR